MVTKFVEEESVEKVVTGNVVIIILYVDNVVLFTNTLGDAQKLMRAFEEYACILN